MQRLPILLSALLLITNCYSQQIDYKGFPQWSAGKKDSTEYLLYTPSGAKPGKKYPLMLFLHGCCGEDYHVSMRNAVDPPVRLWHNFGDNTQTEPTYIISPKTKVGWRQHFANLKSVMDDLVKKGFVDPQRIYISGFSMGSAGTWEFIEAYPGYFAAAIAMGMDFKGKDPSNFKDIPIWAIRGEKDWWARHLGSQIAQIRNLNLPGSDSSEWETGVNPRLTNFENMEHVVMWPAVSQLDLKSWTYSKINDGNKYPVVSIRKPMYDQRFREGENVNLEFHASDPDGTISKTEIFINDRPLKHSTSAQTATFNAAKGDSRIKIVVYDDRGKSTSAEGLVWADIPLTPLTKKLPDAVAGQFYHQKLLAQGNGNIMYSVVADHALPEGLTLSGDQLSGVPMRAGNYTIPILIRNSHKEAVNHEIHLNVSPKKTQDVLLANVKNYKGENIPVSILKKGAAPHCRTDNEVTLSGGFEQYEGSLLIQTDATDTTTTGPFYLQFESDEDVTVFVAYEKLDNLFHSTIPAWLKDFKKENGQLITQYYYYDIYSKDFRKGKIILPHSQQKQNGVNNNYFVMVRRKKIR